MGIPRYPKDMAGEWQKTQRDIKNLFTSANVRKALTQVSTGALDILGTLNILPGGRLNAQYSNGNSAMYIGPVSDGNAQGEGVILRRGDGSEVLYLEGFSDEDSTFRITDKNEAIILADDENGGLAHPYIPHPFSTVVNMPSNSTGSFVTVQKTWIQKQHNRIHLSIEYDITATTGEINIVVEGGSADGTVLALANLPTGSGTEEIGPVDLPGEYLETYYILVQTRVDTGSGDVGCVVLGAYGVKSS